MADREEKVEKRAEVNIKKIMLSPERIASREQAHAIKVAKFLSGGEF